ncbi:putative WD repeat-containing protein [Diplodia seriata]|uniref:Putative WD repeat-containing protein n=1 Tax=Diplodia seriata TaxID=420778 RepID=A0A1S8BIP6_9PEZI|nr:putative WD repeat-containing protein [Diplodia seriata]
MASPGHDIARPAPVQNHAAPAFQYRSSLPSSLPSMDPFSQDSAYHGDTEPDMDGLPDDADSDMEDTQPGGVPIPSGGPYLGLDLGPQPAPPFSHLQSPAPQEPVDDTSSSANEEGGYPWAETFTFQGGAVTFTSLADTGSGTTPAYIPINNQPPSFSLGNAQFAIPPYWEDYEVNTPSVDDYNFKSDICKFMETWRVAAGIPEYGLSKIGSEASRVKHWDRPRSILREDLQGNRYDIQGINWDRLETVREAARDARTRLYQVSVGRVGVLPPRMARKLANTESYFRFRRMNTNHQALIAHFQLRNLIAATSRADIFYAGRSRVMRTDSSGVSTSCVMDLTRSQFDSLHSATFDITSMTASENILIAGGFHGEYALVDLQSEYGSKPTQGFITHEPNGITNHVHTFANRSTGGNMAVFSSNDKRLRVLDCTTNRFVHDFGYEDAINCSATSPNGRMRMVVGDFQETLITDAETGRPFERLAGHDEHTFACAWADDGIHLATGAQDSKVVVYDARWWRQPLSVIASAMACPRSLHFSPVGGGRRVLLSAEADDVVSVMDAQTFDRAQTLDFFGSVSGVSFVPDGSSFFVANSDGKFGGIMEFERAGWGERAGVQTEHEMDGRERGGSNLSGRRVGRAVDHRQTEWANDVDVDADARTKLGSIARRRRGLGLGELVV